ncbi:hypothetical protein [Sphingobium sp. TCM1]|jgi:hypothetical protein|uniref:hypothetical protein n=1 Tax=Sphingobium sp. TCM1 TaxID=453246 RepID=UPI0007F421ED|nr:hypothetical protein [Sphingobium sp. TCM1]OAN52829.1 hypothetical protein A7Q26_06435 [Sphingobium sp. TCM1]
MDTLLSDIEAFLKAQALGAATFGDLVMKDRHLVRQLRNGRRLWPETERKIRHFMATYRPAKTAEKAA